MNVDLAQLTAVARALERRLSLEEVLQILVDGAARLLDVERVSVRLLDGTRRRLIATCRAGEPLHLSPSVEFAVGEGLIGQVAQHARPLLVGDAQLDARFVYRPGQREHVGSFLGVPLMAGGLCIGVLSTTHGAKNRFSAEDESVLTLLSAICAPHIEVARLSRLAQIDPLTGVLNRNGLDLAFPEISAADEGTRPLCAALCDVDRFKLINDEHGHAAGDEVLRHLALRLSSALRAGDVVVRYGGEEFLLILPGVELARAERVLERARAAVEHEPMRAGAAQVSVTFSAGLAERRRGEPREALIARADAALYAAKRSGRNRVKLAR